jgi:glycosyltransferase involved in cell wall biosynthesis
MKIAIFSDTFPPQTNGVANVAHKSAIELAGLGHEVYVLTISSGIRKESHRIESEGYTVIRLPALPAFAYKGHRFALPLGMAIGQIRKIRPDIIHTHTPFSIGIEAVLASKLFHIPIIGTHHTFYDHYLQHIKLDYAWAKKFSWKITVGYYNRCNLILSPSQALADSLINNGLNKPVIIHPNFIDTDIFLPASSVQKKLLKKLYGIGPKAFVYMGRVSYEKNIQHIISAFFQAQKKDNQLQLYIIGDGPERIKLESFVQELGMDDKIFFVGAKYGNELVRYLQACDIFITASKSENMPLSILEAMATGLPVIGVNSLGVPEIVKNNVNGIITEPDSIQEMTDSILKLADNPKLIENFSQNSRKLSLGYSKNILAKSLADIYEKLIK